MEEAITKLRSAIAEVPNFPKPDILYYDITPIFESSELLNLALTQMELKLSGLSFDSFAAIESRGFLFGSAFAAKMGKGLVLIRKPGKLPRERVKVEYDLEYGSDCLEMHVDAVEKNQNVVVVDDILATGGTARAAGELITKAGASVSEFLFFAELQSLDGKRQLSKIPHSILSL